MPQKSTENNIKQWNWNSDHKNWNPIWLQNHKNPLK